MRNLGVVILALLLTGAALAVPSKRQSEYVESLKKKNANFYARMFQDFITINASDEMWNALMADDKNGPSLRSTIAQAAPILAQVAANMKLGTLFKVGLDKDKMEPSTVRMINSWTGKISFDLKLDFTPDPTKMTELKKNLDECIVAFAGFIPPKDKAVIHVVLDPNAKEVKMSRTPDSIHWTLTAHPYRPLSNVRSKVPGSR